MPTLRELQKRLESAETIRQISGAVSSAATAKYTKLCAAVEAYSAYADALRNIVPASNAYYADSDAVSLEGIHKNSICLLVSGNRGMCGGYHQQLFAFFSKNFKSDNMRVAVCGSKALEYCRGRKIPVEASFAISDVPTFSEVKEIAEYVIDRSRDPDVGGVFICYQRFYNMLKSVPEIHPIVSKNDFRSVEDSEDRIFIPRRDYIEREIKPLVIAADVYYTILSAATAAQAATVAAMKSAYENANESISSLNVRINRLRQAAVTAGVLETAADANRKE